MSGCERFGSLLVLHAGGDLSPVEARRLQAHLLGCTTCTQELERYQRVIAAGREGLPGDIMMTDIDRRRIASQAAERARQPGIFRFGPFVSLRPGLVAASIAALIIIAIPVLLRDGGGGREPYSPISSLNVVATPDGQVRLAWSDGSRAAYTVYKSSDPRDFRHGEAHVVVGNAWTDTHPESSPIVFYRIE